MLSEAHELSAPNGILLPDVFLTHLKANVLEGYLFIRAAPLL